MRRLAENYKFKQSIVPASYSAGTENGAGFDAEGAAEVTAVVDVGAIGQASTTLDVKLQQSDDDSTYTDITDAEIVQLSAGSKVATIGARLSGGSKKYVRAVAVVAGTNAAIVGVAAIFGELPGPVVNSPVSVIL